MRKGIIKKILVIFGGVLLLLQVAVMVDAAVSKPVSKHKVRVQYLTYEVIDTQEHSITIRGKRGRVFVLDKEPKGLKIGDKVRYDKLRFKLKRYPKKRAK